MNEVDEIVFFLEDDDDDDSDDEDDEIMPMIRSGREANTKWNQIKRVLVA